MLGTSERRERVMAADEEWVDRYNAVMMRDPNICPRCHGYAVKHEATMSPMPADAKPDDRLPPLVITCTCGSGHKWQKIQN